MVPAIAKTLLYVLDLAWWLIIISAILSWLFAFNIVDVRNRTVRTIGDFFYRATEPLYRPFRRLLPNMGGLDLSPLIVLLIIFFLQQLIAPYAYAPTFRLTP